MDKSAEEFIEFPHECYGERDGWPQWLKDIYIDFDDLYRVAHTFADMQGQNETPSMIAASKGFKAAIDKVLVGIEDLDKIPQSVRECFLLLLNKSFDELMEAIRTSYPAWVREQEGMKRGYAAHTNSWHTLFDEKEEAWLARKPNGKGWLVSADTILMAIQSNGLPVPDKSTVTRERSKRYKKGQ